MKVVYSDPARDIAILNPIDSDWMAMFDTLSCTLSFAEPEVGAQVFLGGFPSYQVGDSCIVYPGGIVGTSVDDGQRFFRVSQTIVKGNSGGPVFDNLGQVIGIATRGVDTQEVMNVAFNGCIPLHTIDRLFFTA
jgi:S1-C subfamily serine protease